jgi:hypothetical protein
MAWDWISNGRIVHAGVCYSERHELHITKLNSNLRHDYAGLRKLSAFLVAEWINVPSVKQYVTSKMKRRCSRMLLAVQICWEP